jgi:hypothetical protein
MRSLTRFTQWAKTMASGFVCLGLSVSAMAQQTPSEAEGTAWSFKLTPSLYATQNETSAADVNLRGNLGNHTTWVGQYVRGNQYQQTRWGYEYNANFDWGQMVPSLQLASKGFAGASLNFHIGGPTYVITGLGRTNLKDYYNLTFDPNDSYVIGFGTKVIDKHVFNLFAVKDNRLKTGQSVTHAVWRWQLNDSERCVIDVSHKTGSLSEGLAVIHGNGLSISYDFGQHFVKLAKEQKVNFSEHDQVLISAGLRF